MSQNKPTQVKTCHMCDRAVYADGLCYSHYARVQAESSNGQSRPYPFVVGA